MFGEWCSKQRLWGDVDRCDHGKEAVDVRLKTRSVEVSGEGTERRYVRRLSFVGTEINNSVVVKQLFKC